MLQTVHLNESKWPKVLILVIATRKNKTLRLIEALLIIETREYILKSLSTIKGQDGTDGQETYEISRISITN